MEFFSFRDSNISMHYTRDEAPVPSDFRMHTHESYELYGFECGSGIYRVEGTPYPLKPGDILIMRPAEAHYIEITDNAPYTRFSVHFTPALLSAIDPEGRLLAPFDNRKSGTRNLYRAENFQTDAYRVFVKNMISDSPDRRLQAVTNVLPLLNEISLAFHTRSEEETEKTLDNRIIRYINRHLSESITLEEICKEFFISKSQLCRIFKKATASTVFQYITVKRLVKARQLILSGVSPTKACLQCGFQDYSSFYRAYKKQYGISPSYQEP